VQTGISDGITDEEFLQYLNDAQRDIYHAIIAVNSKAFTKTAFISTVQYQDKYELPLDVYLAQRIVRIQHTQSGDPKNYINLDRATHGERINREGRPRKYILEGKYLILDPYPNTSRANGVRFIYDPILPKLDTRRATVDSATVNGSSLDALTIDSSFPAFNEDDWLEDDYLCIVDDQGTILAKGIQYDSVDGAGVVTLASGSHTLGDGETVPAGSYVVRGSFASTHSSLQESCEDYLLGFGAWKIFKRDSSTDAQEKKQEIDELKGMLIQNYADNNDDPILVPITDLTYDMEEYW
jgi:hypothetical protein